MQKRKLFIDRKDGKRVENVSGLSQEDVIVMYILTKKLMLLI